jgi:hypothetical protein
MKTVLRDQASALSRLLRTFPAVLVYGPRQSGKSTLLRAALSGWPLVDLERPSDLALVEADLEGFLAAHGERLAIDEAQRMPAVFPALRHQIDRSNKKGRFVLTGSADPALVRSVSESLAGRIGLLELTPFTGHELRGTRREAERWFWGGYPPVLGLRTAQARREWLASYVATFLERDLPTLGVRLPSRRLRLLWTMLTHVHGNLLNVADLARSLAVSSHTVAGDLDVLEATFMIRRLQPYFANVQKRLTKSAKLYIRDTGLLHFLAGLRQPAELEAWPRRGHSFEGLVIEELAAWAHRTIVRPELFFWRTQAGAEVDLLIADGQRLIPVEIKLGSTVDARSLNGLRQCMADLSLRRGYVVYSGLERRTLDGRIDLVPWDEVRSGRFEPGTR